MPAPPAQPKPGHPLLSSTPTPKPTLSVQAWWHTRWWRRLPGVPWRPLTPPPPCWQSAASSSSPLGRKTMATPRSTAPRWMASRRRERSSGTVRWRCVGGGASGRVLPAAEGGAGQLQMAGKGVAGPAAWGWRQAFALLAACIQSQHTQPHTHPRAAPILPANPPAEPKIALLGAMQSLFEGSMYTFVFLWTPALRCVRGDGPLCQPAAAVPAPSAGPASASATLLGAPTSLPKPKLRLRCLEQRLIS